jgi:hypothetical protein
MIDDPLEIPEFLLRTQPPGANGSRPPPPTTSFDKPRAEEPATAVDLAEANRFLKLLDPNAKQFTFQTFDDKKKGEAGDPKLARVIPAPSLSEPQRLYEQGAGVYVTVNATDGTGRKRENIKRVRAVWQEDDGGQAGPLPLEPSLVVETSPRHFHRYWLVRDDWPTDEQGRADFDALMERMVATHGSDKNAKDLSRVLRIPGFLHRKDPAAPHMIRIVSASGRRYSRAEILKAFPPVERAKKAKAPPEAKASGKESPARIRDALRSIPADERQVWLEIGMALKAELGDGGYEPWVEWSRNCPKYNHEDQARVWGSLNGSGITIATLFHRAREAGWRDPDEKATEKAIEDLAALSEIAYQKRRAQAAQDLGIGVGVLDKIVRKCRARTEEAAAELPHWNVELWEEAVDGAALLNDIEKLFRRYIVMPAGAGEALALWTLHAWTMDAGDISPFMALVSPTKRCGKTNVLTILYYLTPRSELASNISPSALFRYIEDVRPTLLIDEADSFAKENEELRGILNSGHTRTGANVIRNVEVNGEHKPRRFSTWAPKAIATIRSLADTLEDRSIVVMLQRKHPTATVARLRKRDSEEFEMLRRKAARWAADNFDHLADPDPAMPEALNDRAADNWRPLLAIAELAGDTWARRAWDAACLLSGEGHDTAANVQILADIYRALGNVDVILSAELVTKLTADPERPWAEWNRGKPLTQKQLAGLLKPFGIFSETVHPKSGPHGRGYKRATFLEAWEAYLPGQNTLSPSIDPSEVCKRANADGMGTSDDFRSVQEEGQHTSKNTNFSYSHAALHTCTLQKPQTEAVSEIYQGEIDPDGFRRMDL